MKGTTHLGFGLATGVATALLLTPYATIEQQVSLATGCALGSLLVDIDNDKSTIGHSLKPFSTIIQKLFGHRNLIHSPVFWVILYFGLQSLINYTNVYSDQRSKVLFIAIGLLGLLSFVLNLKGPGKIKRFIKNFFLYILMPLFLCEVCAMELTFTLYGLTLGAFGHLLLDLMTVGGVPLLYPIRWKNKNGEKHVKRFSLLPMKSGTWCETIVALLLFIGFFFLLMAYVKQIEIQSIYNPFVIYKNMFINFFASKFS